MTMLLELSSEEVEQIKQLVRDAFRRAESAHPPLPPHLRAAAAAINFVQLVAEKFYSSSVNLYVTDVLLAKARIREYEDGRLRALAKIVTCHGVAIYAEVLVEKHTVHTRLKWRALYAGSGWGTWG